MQTSFLNKFGTVTLRSANPYMSQPFKAGSNIQENSINENFSVFLSDMENLLDNDTNVFEIQKDENNLD